MSGFETYRFLNLIMNSLPSILFIVGSDYFLDEVDLIIFLPTDPTSLSPLHTPAYTLMG